MKDKKTSNKKGPETAIEVEVPGFVAGAVAAGLKKGGKKDLALIVSEVSACAAGVFTTNKVQAAPVIIDKERIKSGRCKAIIVNSGCANACTGKQGIRDAEAVARAAAGALGVPEEMVLVASTGVIGARLDVAAIEASLPGLLMGLSPKGLGNVAEAIMTTDTFAKVASRKDRVRGKSFSVAGVAKGAGMIHPNMATMLCFVCTDMGAEPHMLNHALTKAVSTSFNSITVDGDTSTNDTVIVLANGMSGLNLRDAECEAAFQAVLDKVLSELAMQVVRDAEGATKLVSVKVAGALSDEDARRVAGTVANSLLVKTALFGEDANWGRIIAAAGRAVAVIDPDRIDIFFDDVCMVKDGTGCGDDAEKAATRVLKTDNFSITIDLKLGSKSATVHTCDISCDYVKINADYRS